MELSMLILATFAQGWSKWFSIGLIIGAVIFVIVGIVTLIQARRNPDVDAQNTAKQQDEHLMDE